MKLYENIRNRRIELKMTQQELASKLGYKSTSTITKIEAGENDIPQSKIAAFAEALDTTPGELLGLDGIRTVVPENIVPIKKKSFPVLGTIAAGKPIEAQQYIETYVPADDDLGADYALIIKGDSMVGAGINDGDIVFIRQQPDVENGEIAAVYIDGSATLKRVYKEDGAIELWSANPKYRPMVFTASNCNELRILGKAVKKLSDIK